MVCKSRDTFPLNIHFRRFVGLPYLSWYGIQNNFRCISSYHIKKQGKMLSSHVNISSEFPTVFVNLHLMDLSVFWISASLQYLLFDHLLTIKWLKWTLMLNIITIWYIVFYPKTTLKTTINAVLSLLSFVSIKCSYSFKTNTWSKPSWEHSLILGKDGSRIDQIFQLLSFFMLLFKPM